MSVLFSLGDVLRDIDSPDGVSVDDYHIIR